jgi:signal transduction histidine kinase
MVGMVLISAVCAWLSFGFTKYIFYTTEPYYTYPSNFGLQQRIKGLAPVIQQMQPDEINHSLNRQMKKTGMKLMIVSKEGDVLYHSGNVSETKVDLYQIQMKMARQEEAVRHDLGSREIVALYPFSLKNKDVYFIAGKKDRPVTGAYQRVNSVLTSLTAVLIFIMVYFLLTNKKLKQIKMVVQGMNEIAAGNFSCRLQETGRDEIASMAVHVNRMAEQLEKNREQEQKAERERTGLITGISHDLRTPLTSVIGYLRFVQDHSDMKKEELVSSVKIALSKAEKMKQMIDDLFDYARLTHDQIQIQKETISLNTLLEQLLEESFMLREQNDLEIKKMLCNGELRVKGDPLLMVRLFDNLIQNAVRYAKRPGFLEIMTHQQEKKAVIEIGNPAEPVDPDTFQQLFGMFVTGDPSRSKGGSGLGLAIVKRIVEMHQGTIQACQREGMIRFHIRLPAE